MTSGHFTESPLDRALLLPLRAHHAFEACVEQLASGIRLGVYPPDSQLPSERELAARMEVSRATVREAIAALRMTGMVKTKRGRGGGTVVSYEPQEPGAEPKCVTSRQSLREILEFRWIVESGAAHVAAGLDLDEGKRTFLQDLLRDVSAASNPALHRQADSRLHLGIAAVTDSELLIEAVARAQMSLHEMLVAIPVLEVNIDHSNSQHEAIVDAILTGDAFRARRVMEAHCDDTAALLRGLLG